MAVVKVTISSSPSRKQPKAGDRRTTKKYGEQIRVPRLARTATGQVIGYDYTGGRQRFDWVSVEGLPDCWKHLLKKGGL